MLTTSTDSFFIHMLTLELQKLKQLSKTVNSTRQGKHKSRYSMGMLLQTGRRLLTLPPDQPLSTTVLTGETNSILRLQLYASSERFLW